VFHGIAYGCVRPGEGVGAVGDEDGGIFAHIVDLLVMVQVFSIVWKESFLCLKL
jgi:hypothetical protein